jgi:hypothetical protein
MKKREIFIVMSMLTFAVANGQLTRIGGGMTYGTGFHFNNEQSGELADLNRSPFIGIFVTGTYKLNLPVNIAPSFTYFIPRSNEIVQAVGGEATSKVSSMMFDLNGHWIFYSPGSVEFYALGGLDITFARLRLSGFSSGENDNAIGLNLGVGTYLKLTEQFGLYAEAKYIVSKYDQVMLNAGVLLNLKLSGRKANP